MTGVAPPEATGRSQTRMTVIHAAALALWAVGAVLVSRSGAGLAGFSVLWGTLLAVPLYVVARGWRLPWWLHVGAAALPVSVLVVAVADYDGWFGASRAAHYGYGAVLLLSVTAWAGSPRRRIMIACIAALVVLDQYATAWFPWWGSGDPGHLMWGTFYWHNQFAVYCVAGAAFAIALVMLRKRTTALLGTVGVLFATAGTLASGSRMGLAFLGFVYLVAAIVGVIALGWRSVLRWGALLVSALLTSAILSSRLFFPNSTWPWQTVIGRSANGSFESSGVSRLEFWRVGLLMGRDHALTGAGLLNFGPFSACYARTSFSSNPHNEWVLAWAEGGTVGLLPVLAVLVGALILVVRSLRPLPRGSAFRHDPARWGGLVALVVLLAHAGMDFDWAYPALVGMAGIAAGVALAPFFITATTTARRGHAATAIVLMIVLMAATGAGRILDPVAHDPLTPLNRTSQSTTVQCSAGAFNR